MKGQTERYMQFPLSLLRGIFTDKKDTINKIMDFGIYNYSLSFSFSKHDVARQLMYSLYRSDLSNELEETINEFITEGKISYDEDFCANNGNTDGIQINQIAEVLTVFEIDSIFEAAAIDYYRVHLSMQSLKISGSIEHILRSGKNIKNGISNNEPLPMINVKRLFNFRDSDKSEFDIAQFAAYVSIKSILGTKQFVKTNKAHIVSRMFGYSSIKHLPSKMNPAIKGLFTKYNNRYHIDKVLQHLELNWNVLTYSNNIRGMYVAMENKISIDDLALISETKKQKNRINELKNAKTKAKERALQQLKKAPQLK